MSKQKAIKQNEQTTKENMRNIQQKHAKTNKQTTATNKKTADKKNQ